MKILFTQESDWLQRNMHQQHHLAELISLRGHEVRVIDYEIMHGIGLWSKRRVYTDVNKIYLDAKVTVIRPGVIKIPGLDYLSLLLTHRQEIARQLAHFKPDVVVGWGILNSLLASNMVDKVPFVYYWIDVLHELIPAAPFRTVGKVVEKTALKKTDRVLAINQRLKEYVAGLGYPKNEIDVLGAGIDPDRFNSSVSGKEIREQYGFKDDDIVLFFMGWLYNFSGLVEVITEIHRCGDKHIKLLVVGDGEAYETLSGIVRDLKVEEGVLFAGKKPYSTIPQYIAASDICILPAHTKEKIMQHIVPIKMYEYLAMGKPVISTCLPGVVKEFGYSSGVAYANQSEDVITVALSLIGEGKLVRMREQAVACVKDCRWDSITDKFESILQQVIEDKKMNSPRPAGRDIKLIERRT